MSNMSTSWHSFRSHKAFITFVLAYAAFVDQFIFTSITPVAPYALTKHSKIDEKDLQHWIAVLLAVYGAAMFVVSREYLSLQTFLESTAADHWGCRSCIMVVGARRSKAAKLRTQDWGENAMTFTMMDSGLQALPPV
jgi:hypothetical protein